MEKLALALVAFSGLAYGAAALDLKNANKICVVTVGVRIDGEFREDLSKKFSDELFDYYKKNKVTSTSENFTLNKCGNNDLIMVVQFKAEYEKNYNLYKYLIWNNAKFVNFNGYGDISAYLTIGNGISDDSNRVIDIIGEQIIYFANLFIKSWQQSQ